eukprot:1489733-Prymnesium_polylepis.1
MASHAVEHTDQIFLQWARPISLCTAPRLAFPFAFPKIVHHRGQVHTPQSRLHTGTGTFFYRTTSFKLSGPDRTTKCSKWWPGCGQMHPSARPKRSVAAGACPVTCP